MNIKLILAAAIIVASPTVVMAEEATAPIVRATTSDGPDQILLSTQIVNPKTVRQVRFTARMEGRPEAMRRTLEIDPASFEGRAHAVVTVSCGRDLTYRVRIERIDGSVSYSDYGHYTAQACATDNRVQQEHTFRQAERENAEFRDEIARAGET